MNKLLLYDSYYMSKSQKLKNNNFFFDTIDVGLVLGRADQLSKIH